MDIYFEVTAPLETLAKVGKLKSKFLLDLWLRSYRQTNKHYFDFFNLKFGIVVA